MRRVPPVQMFATPALTLRRIRSVGELAPGEVAVTIKARRALTSAVRQFMPLPKPSDLAFEIWRLKQRKLTFGQIVRHATVAPFLAPRSKSADANTVRLALVKKYVRQVTAFLATPVGQAIQSSESWSEWVEHGHDPQQLKLSPFPGYRPDEDAKTNLLDYRDYTSARRR